MNKVILMGRLVRDPELKSTSNGISRATFSLAVDRRFKNANGEREVDFISIVAWRQTAEFISRYFSKGQRIAIVGSIQTRTWDDPSSGKKYITEVIADEAYFADSKSSTSPESNNYRSNNQNNNYDSYESNNFNNSDDNGFFDAPDDDTELPFDL